MRRNESSRPVPLKKPFYETPPPPHEFRSGVVDKKEKSYERKTKGVVVGLGVGGRGKHVRPRK